MKSTNMYTNCKKIIQEQFDTEMKATKTSHTKNL